MGGLPILAIAQREHMRALQFRHNPLRYAWVRGTTGVVSGCATGPGSFIRLADIPEPVLPSPQWLRIRPTLSGICGSDLGVITARASVYLSALTSFPFVPGHEVVGIITDVGTETGTDVKGLEVGQRVCLEPVLGCRVRDIDPPCQPCAQGRYGNCENVTGGCIAAGVQTGFCRDTGGGWGSSLVAHRLQVHPIPESLPDHTAVLAEPLSCAIHGVLMSRIYPDSRVLVVGCGTMGLLTIAALHTLTPAGSIVAMGRHAYQRELAMALGADEVTPSGQAGYRRLTELAPSAIHSLPIGKPAVTGGFDVAFDCVGSGSSLEDALRWTRPQGEVTMLGMPAPGHIDLTPFWYQEVHLNGSYTYAMESYEGADIPTFHLALDLLQRDDMSAKLGGLVRHTFALRSYRKAIAIAMRPGRHQAIKTAFDLENG